MSLQPTNEQQAILDAHLNNGEVMIVNAYAGTGKTTTLQMYANTHRNKRLIYLCFNRDLAEEARDKMPANVESKTIHSLAFAHVGKNYKHKLAKGMRSKEISDYFSEKKYPVTAQYAYEVGEAITNYTCSTSEEIGREHVALGLLPDQIEEIVKLARAYWADMCDPQNEKAGMIHDGYLKLFSLDKAAVRNRLSKYDEILLDEAQDSNPITLQMLSDALQEKTAAVVAVGDKHQAIYSFRKAVNAIEKLERVATHKRSLTDSFRCNQSIANNASMLLRQFKEDTVRLRGCGGKTVDNHTAVLSRSNAALISYAYDSIVYDDAKVHFAGTHPRQDYSPYFNYGFSMIESVYWLFVDQKEKVKDPYIKRFDTYQEVREFAKGEDGDTDTMDKEINAIVDFVEQHKNHTLKCLNTVTKNSTSPQHCSITLSTAHKSKGCEWDKVELLDGYVDLFDAETKEKCHHGDQKTIEEINLLYVAMTRARKEVVFPETLLGFFEPDIQNAKPA